MKRSLRYIIAVALLIFGMLTLFLSTSIIFDWFGIREKEGDFVWIVVVANFTSSLVYLASAYGLVVYKKWTSKLLWTSVGILVVAALGFLIHISTGGLYETKTIGALVFRIVLTVVFALSSHNIIKNHKV